jgi:23S rRNA (uracil1939-C5)-methyltransferase
MKKEKVKIRDLSATAEGVGQTEKGVIFVDGALPEEEVEVQITLQKKNYAKANLLCILKASPHRIDPPCEYFDECGGCSLQHATISFQEEIKRNRVYEALSRIAGIKEPEVQKCISSEKQYGYRNKITLPLLEVDGQKKIGFFKKRSHDIISIDSCLLHIPFADVVYRKVKDILLNANIPFYDEKKRDGFLQHLVIRTSLHENRVLIGLIGLTKPTREIRKAAKSIAAISNVKGVVYGKKKKAVNSIYPDSQEVLYGEGELTELILGIPISLSPLSFFQVNKDVAEKLYLKAFELADLKEGDKVLDAYAGSGTFAIFLAKNKMEVTAIESFKKSVEDGKRNAQNNDVSINYIEGEVEGTVHALQGFDCVFINPPRKGVDDSVIKALGKIGPKKILYTSCDPGTLARDLKKFEQEGYLFKKAIPFDMFPQTIHVETVVLIEKNVASI